MALSCDWEYRNVGVKPAYIRIVGTTFSRERGDAFISAHVLANSEALLPIDTITLSVPYATDTGNVVEWAYSQLKALPEFADAIDA